MNASCLRSDVDGGPDRPFQKFLRSFRDADLDLHAADGGLFVAEGNGERGHLIQSLQIMSRAFNTWKS